MTALDTRLDAIYRYSSYNPFSIFFLKHALPFPPADCDSNHCQRRCEKSEPGGIEANVPD